LEKRYPKNTKQYRRFVDIFLKIRQYCPRIPVNIEKGMVPL
jgi:hypothetical protein